MQDNSKLEKLEKLDMTQREVQIERDKLHNEEIKLKLNQDKNIPLLDRIENARRNIEALGRLKDWNVLNDVEEALRKNIKVMNEVTEIK